ncbi:retrovirus-related Pol polyprotein from transposon RE1 isoform X2 [Raphanus sativus]|uniref:Retrovirus-related Pol polyprotein from transposon RE1 isoform X2 n=1 Tax=Raphanus sativus TaxID=3726 RepID=A0A9W3BY21_RAPSA|nr:retrovirus-related Pol polyprotein from transposon RE1 isoform X2 [Raphanus sativus]
MIISRDRTSRMLIGAGEREGEGLYRFRGIESLASAHTRVLEESMLWHRRLGHPSSRITGMISDISSSAADNHIRSCDICFRAKQTRLSFTDSFHNANEIFDLIHCDLWGPYRATALCGSRYFLTIIDDHSRAVWLYLLPDKTMVSQQIKDFFTLIERQFSKKIKTIRSDNGTEFMCLTRYFKENGILHETSCVHTPQQNGRAERKHRHILNIARALRFQANLPIEFWGECVLAAGHLINRTPSSILQNKTPYEKLHGQPPDISHLRILGCLAYAHNKNTKGDKFASRSRRCMFLGYPSGTKGWKLFDLDEETVFISRDVEFQEEVFPYHDKSPIITAPSSTLPVISPICDSETEDSAPITEQTTVATELLLSTSVPSDSTTTNDQTDIEPLGRGQRTRQPSTRFRDYVINTVTTIPVSTLSLPSSVPQPFSGTDYPLSDYLTYDRLSSSHRSFLLALTINIEPKHFRQAMEHEVWRNSMKSEMDALERNHTWDLEELPNGKNALGTQWIYTIKLRADGTIERHKSRLVVLGNNQKEGLDYTETFSPVAKMTTVRLFLDIAAKKNYELHQMDVHNAFLHGDLLEEVYIKIPLGFARPNDTRVCRLRKSLYGLKQAPRCWFAKLVDALLSYGFTQTHSDHSLFVYVRSRVTLRILVYVDDLIISGNSPPAIKTFKTYLSTCFHMKDLGALKYFLGLEVARSPQGIYLSQRKYTLDIITECGLLGCKPAGSPMDQNHKLAKATGLVLADPEKYRRLTGRLIYLLATRPDLAYSVHILSQFMQTPQEDHWLAALKVVRYLKGTVGQGILFSATSSLSLTGWCDADWGGCLTTRRSLSGWIIQLGTSPITWKTKKQDGVSLSSTEAEFRSLRSITKEIIWLKELLRELGINHEDAVTVCCDNKSAIHLSANPVLHEQTKHMGIICQFVRDEITKGVIKMVYVPTSEQFADILTKALGRKEFDAFLLKLGINNIHAPT